MSLAPHTRLPMPGSNGLNLLNHSRKRLSAALLLASTAALLATVSAAEAKPGDPTANVPQSPLRPEIIRSVKNDVSPALRTIAPGAPFISPTKEIPNRALVDFVPNPKPIKEIDDFLEQAGPDSVLQSSPGIGNIPTTSVNFDGVNNRNGVLPPDTSGDVGPNHYVQWVNLSYGIYNKAGTLQFGPFNGNALWAGFGGLCETTNRGDIIVLYDPLADRWMFSQWAFTSSTSGPYHQCFAVSTGPDPAGTYNRYDFIVSQNKFNDYAKLAVWPDAYYMTANQFLNGSSFAGAGVWAFEREKMLQGLPAQLVYFDLQSANPNFGGVLPADVDGAAPPAGTPGYFAEIDDAAFGFPTDQLALWEFRTDWQNPTNSTFGLSGQPNLLFTPPTLAPFAPVSCVLQGTRNCIPQLGTTRRIDAIADRLMYRLAYRNYGSSQSLYMNATVDPGVTGSLAGIRWLELRNTGSGYSIFQQGTYAPDATNRWMGSIAADGDGNIALGFSASDATIFPSIRYAGRLTTDALGTLGQGEGTLIAGLGAQTSTSSRWGDYSTMAVDPLDNCTFWYTTEYYTATSNSSWSTRVGAFKFPSCDSSPRVLSATRTGAVGSTVVIDGSNFDPNPGNTTVTFYNRAPGTITAITPTTIRVTVPAGAVSGPIRIATPLGRSTTPTKFVVTP